jgi:hypothetical protein
MTFLLKDTDQEVGGCELVGRTITAIGPDGTYNNVLIVGAWPHHPGSNAGADHQLVLRPQPGVLKHVNLDGLDKPRVSDDRQAVMEARIPDHGSQRSYEGVWVSTVTIVKTCLVCGGPRGEKDGGHHREDGAYYRIDTWSNPCGHVDYFENVLTEAGVHRKEEER